MSKRAGFTLVEMLVVLLILAAIAGTALNAGLGFADDARLEQTRSTLNSLERACLGDPQAIDASGRPRSFGFVNDIGRLPISPLELLEPSPSLAPFQQVQLSSDPRVWIGSGWRGPYYRTAWDEPELRDGWANPLQIELTPAGTFGVLRSLGKDNAAGGLGYDADFSIVFENRELPSRAHGSVLVRVKPFQPSATTRIVARVYGPVAGIATTIEQQIAVAASTTELLFPKLAIGSRILCVYQLESAELIQPNDPLPAGHRTTTPRRIDIPAGGLPEEFFDLSNP